MNHRTEIPPEISRTEVGLVVVTVRHTGDATGEWATTASLHRGEESWPDGLLSWTLFIATDGQALMAYEQWTGDAALDVALASAPPYVPGIPGTEQSAPVRYRLHRSHAIAVEKTPVGCVVTPVFDVDGPERQRHFVDEILALAQQAPPVPGAIAAHFHTSTDGTRVVNYAEWVDEQSHVDAITADDPRGVRRRATGEIPGTRPCGYRRWHPHTALAATGGGDGR
ncbi:antibiotic biosynthesis monooxygenase family protein [Streptomyces atacamensis]|uniref:hypothetical protein n=1 Tax=Streptomyces atacamensis TaxID=531966 RepID=UPI00399CEB10